MEVLAIILSLIVIVKSIVDIIKRVELGKYAKDNNTPKEQIIRFDLKDNKSCIIGIFLSILLIFVLTFIIMFYRRLGVFLCFWIAVIFCAIFVLILLGNFIGFIFANRYLASLRRQGYIAPQDKRDYDYLVSRLVSADEALLEEDEPLRDASSIIEMVITLLVFAICIGYDIYFAITYDFLSRDIAVLARIMGFLDIFWLICAILFYRNSDNTRYKNKGQTVLGRKTRMSVLGFVIFLMIFACITFFIKKIFKDFSVFIFKTNCSINMQIEDAIAYAANEAIENGLAITDEKLEQIEEGVNILDWDSDCQFADYILEKLDQASFKDIAHLIRNTYEQPQVMMCLEDDQTRVEICGAYTLYDFYDRVH